MPRVLFAKCFGDVQTIEWAAKTWGESVSRFWLTWSSLLLKEKDRVSILPVANDRQDNQKFKRHRLIVMAANAVRSELLPLIVYPFH